DVAAVHAGYAKRRTSLLEAGIRLYELRRLSTDAGTNRSSGRTGSSSDSSLHAKTFSVDRSRVFVGSFNFDPRSARLNTEMGFVVESEPLASSLAEALDRDLARVAYEVRLNGDSLEWIDGATRHTTEPGTGAF